MQTVDVQDYIERAYAAIREGELDLAEEYFNLVLESAPDHSAAVDGLKQVRVARVQKSWSRPLQVLLEAWSRLLMALGRYDRAAGYLELLYRTNSGHFSAVLNYARCCDKLGRCSDALDAYRVALSLHPNHVPSLRRLASLAAEEERLDEAIDYLKRLALLFPDDEQIEHRMRDLLAREYAQAGVPEKLTERRAQMEKKLRELPGSPEFTRQLEQMEELRQRSPDDMDLSLRLVAHLREGGLLDRAAIVLAPVIDSNPKNFEARLEQARLWRAEEELVIAANLFEELLDERPEDEEIRQEHWDCRVALLRKQVEKNPEDEGLKTQLREVERQRDLQRIAILKTRVREHPENHPQRLELGQLLLKTKNYDESISILQRLLQEPSYAGQAFTILGSCFRERGQLDLAADEYRKGIEFFKNRGYSHIPTEDLKEAYYYLGLCLEQQGKLEAAREAYKPIYTTDINYRDIRDRYEQTYRT